MFVRTDDFRCGMFGKGAFLFLLPVYSNLQYLICFLGKRTSRRVSNPFEYHEWAVVISARMSVFHIVITFICKELSSDPASDSSHSMVSILEPSSKRRR